MTVRTSRRSIAATAIGALVVAVAAMRVSGETPTPHARAGGTPATVVRVIDGDTVDVRLDSGVIDRVRILGIDTPEVVDPRRPVQCFGPEASARTKELLPPGRAVILEDDPTQDARDRYGRRLAHIVLDGDAASDASGANVGRILVAEGYARHYVYQRTPTAHGAEYAAAEATARASGLGLWSPETCDGRTTRRTGSDRGA
jgi:micrococcal nuclease